MLFERRSIVQLLKDIRQGRLTCVKLMEQCIDRSIKTKSLNHFVYQDHKQMLQSAIEADNFYKSNRQRPLEGIPIGIKDNIDTTDSPTTGGSASLKGHVPKYDCMLWYLLKVNGAISGGKLNMHEFGLGTTTGNGEYGLCYSALDNERTAGGSSGGSGGAVGTGAVPISLGTDTVGSIKTPASCNGIIGYRTTVNRWPSDFGVHMSILLDTVGPMAVAMEDVSYLDEIVTNQKPYPLANPSQIRIGIPNSRFYEDLNPEVEKIAQRAINNLKKAGFKIIEGDGPQEINDFKAPLGKKIVEYEIIDLMEQYIKKHNIKATLETVVKGIKSPDVLHQVQKMMKEKVTDEEFNVIYHDVRAQYRKDYYAYFERNKLDAILYPTMPNLPPKFTDLEGPELLLNHNGKKWPYFVKSTQNTDPSALLNFPSISLPAKRIDEGIPINMELMSPTGDDRKLISVASVVEQFII